MNILVRDQKKKNHIDKNGVATPHMKRISERCWLAIYCDVPTQVEEGGESNKVASPIDFARGGTMIEAYKNLKEEFSL